MFIVLKEVAKYIVKLGIEWLNFIEEEDLISALMGFFIAPILILFIIIAFIGDIVLFPLEIILYLIVRKIKNERNK